MNKPKLITQIALRAGLTRKDAEKALDAVLDSIADVLADGDRINFPGFGSFETRVRSARTCRNIHTGEPIAVEAATVPVFRPARQLKERVDQYEVG